MLLPKIIDTIAAATKKKGDNAYAFNSVEVTENRVIATDGHSLYYASIANNYTDADFPADFTQGTDNAADTGNGILNGFPLYIPAATLEKAIRNRPKKGTLNIVQENIQLTESHYQGTETSTRAFSLVTSDMETFDTVSFRAEDTAFPNTTALIESVEKASVSEEESAVSLSVEQLDKLVKLAKKAGAETVSIGITSERSPVRIDAGHFQGLIMPWVDD